MCVYIYMFSIFDSTLQRVKIIYIYKLVQY